MSNKSLSDFFGDNLTEEARQDLEWAAEQAARELSSNPRFSFTERKFECNGVLVLTLWEGDYWCCASALPLEKQTPENILLLKASMVKAAKRPGAPRNGIRKAVKC